MTTSATLTYWGPFLLERKDEQLRVSGHPQDPDPSPLGQSLKQSQECRVAKPSVRRSWLDSGPGSAPELRGREPFVEIEWDEALALVAGELERVRDAHGHEAIFAGSYGWGSTGRFHMPSAQLFRFMRASTWVTHFFVASTSTSSMFCSRFRPRVYIDLT